MQANKINFISKILKILFSEKTDGTETLHKAYIFNTYIKYLWQ